LEGFKQTRSITGRGTAGMGQTAEMDIENGHLSFYLLKNKLHFECFN